MGGGVGDGVGAGEDVGRVGRGWGFGESHHRL